MRSRSSRLGNKQFCVLYNSLNCYITYKLKMFQTALPLQRRIYLLKQTYQETSRLE